MEKHLISIIIPVYKVELYLRQCVDSVINQTYKNLEIILVDDGSPDSCPFICDEYARLDKRVKVVHKKNGGISDARNRGIKHATGEYIIFVDADDWLAKDACRVLNEILLHQSVDIVGFDHAETKEDESFSDYKCNRQLTVISAADMYKKYMRGELWQHSACSKIYKKELFEHIKFPLGMLGEDYATTYLLLSVSNRVAHVNMGLYFYRIRPESIMRQNSVKLVQDVYRTACAIYEFEKQKFPEEAILSEKAYCNCLLKTYARLFNEDRVLYRKELSDIDARLRIIKTDILPTISQLAYWIYRLNRRIFAKIMRVIGKNG